MAATCTAHRHGQRRAEERQATVLIGGAETGGRLAIVEEVIGRGAELPRHLHHWEDETLYVLEGELAVCLGGEWHQIRAGGAILLPRGVEHAVGVVGAATRVLTVLTPAGFEGFYRDLAGAARDLDRLVAMAARYGCEITGPAPTPPASALAGGPAAT